MKPLKFKKLAWIFALIIFTNAAIYAGTDEYSKEIKKEYDVDEHTLIDIENKYGDVNIINWNKDKVSFEIQITVDHRNEEKARELLEYINVDLSQSDNTIKAVTEIDSKFNRSGGIFNFSSNNKEFSIDYTVKMPKNLNINLANKYGNVHIDELTGRANIKVKYGNLKANKIIRDNTNPMSHVSLGYSDGSIKEVEWLKFEIKYSELEMEKTKALIGISKYSKLYIDENSSIVCESKYDKYEVGQLSNFVCEAKYTDFKFDKLDEQLDLTTKYGDIQINTVDKNFKKINIDNGYGRIKLGIDKEASYHLDGNADYADIKYPGGNNINKIEKNTNLKVSGIIGKNKDTKSEVKIDTKYGDVNLNQ
ncbi:MAG: DUF4097 family beta strand repeat-containing protein [Bacteroidales bacterium]